MSVSKVIKFYKFEPQPSMSNNGLNPIDTIDALKIVFPRCEAHSFKYDGDEYTIDILEIGTSFIFGTCAKKSELKLTSFYQMRDKQTNKAEPYTTIDPNTQLEVYTYFYIDSLKNRMAAIQHKSISKIHSILSDFIYTESKNMLKFFVAPEKIADIKKAARGLKKTSKLHLSFAPGKSKDNIKSLVQLFDDFEYDSYSIDIKLLDANNHSMIDKLVELSTNEKDTYNGIKLTGTNEYGLEETINFLEALYTKNTPFDITDDIVLNISIIRDKLAQSLA